MKAQIFYAISDANGCRIWVLKKVEQKNPQVKCSRIHYCC